MIDAHTHIDDEVTYQSYKQKLKNTFELAFVLHWYKDDLTKVADFVNSKPDLRLIAGVGIGEPTDISIQLSIIERMLVQKQAIGIKLYPGYQHFYVSDKRVEPVAELCIKYDKPLVVHSGDVYDEEGEAVLKYSHPADIDELAIKFPKLKIVVAHFGFPHLLETANIVAKNHNVYTDISGTLCEDLTVKEEKALFNEYRKDLMRAFSYFPNIKTKIMFGTDCDWNDSNCNDASLYIQLVKKLFSSVEQKNVFSDLAKSLFLEQT